MEKLKNKFFCECLRCNMQFEYNILSDNRLNKYDIKYCPYCQSENIEITIVDEIGGFHNCGLGWNPDGDFCGECSKTNCKDCYVWIENNLTCKDCKFSQVGFFTKRRLYCGKLSNKSLTEVDFNDRCKMFIKKNKRVNYEKEIR